MSQQLDILDPVTRQHVERAAEALQREFAGVFSQETIARYIAESTDLLGGATVNVFVPVLVHRFARERLKALGQAEGTITKEQPEVLFVCVHNAGRSQMAAGLVKLRSEGRVHVRSAGSAPGERDQPGGRRGDDRDRRRHERGVPEAAHRRGRPRGGRRDHDGLRRRLSDLPGQAVRGLGARRSGRAGARGGPPSSATRSTRRVQKLVAELTDVVPLARRLVAEANRHVHARLRRVRGDHGRREDARARPRRRRVHASGS